MYYLRTLTSQLLFSLLVFSVLFYTPVAWGINTDNCLNGNGPYISLSGIQQTRFDTRANLLKNYTVIDATSAQFNAVNNYPVMVYGGTGVCWHGGAVQGNYPPTATWDTMHGTTAVDVSSQKIMVEDLRVDDYGDGVSFNENSFEFTLRRAYFSYIRDDCVQNDYLHAGLVDDSLFDGCYSAFSARTYAGQPNVTDGSTNVWTIQNSLVRLQPMEKVYKDRGTIPGHDGFFKWDLAHNWGPQLALHNNIFRVDQDANNVGLGLPAGKLKECANNTIVWLGRGSYPAQIPASFNGQPCFTITTDKTVWDNAVTAWKSAHSDVASTPSPSATVSPTITAQPSVSPTPSTCSTRATGDALCDGVIDLADYELFRREFVQIDTQLDADFNADGVVNLIDFEIWRRNFH
jgi:hypothetical protein